MKYEDLNEFEARAKTIILLEKILKEIKELKGNGFL